MKIVLSNLAKSDTVTTRIMATKARTNRIPDIIAPVIPLTTLPTRELFTV